MVELGVIGTGWIADCFVQAALETGKYKLAGVYSRTLATAKAFGEKYGATSHFDELEAFVGFEEIATVYISSPNSLHFEHALACIGAGKNVIVEKPAFSNYAEAQKAFAYAREKGVFLLEAARHIYEENFGVLAGMVGQLGELQGGCFSFIQYSSRYGKLLAGEEPNVFSLRYSGGALADLGVYLVYEAVALFGVPKAFSYQCHKLRTGVDGAGVMLLEYDGFTLTLHCGKTADAFVPNEIWGSEGALQFAPATHIESVKLYLRSTGEWQEHARPKTENMMQWQTLQMARLLESSEQSETWQEYATLERLALDVSRITTEMRKQAGICFAADDKEIGT